MRANAQDQFVLAQLWLTPQDRRMLDLRARVGLTVQSIADLTGRAPSTVSRRLKQLNKRLEQPLVQSLLQHPELWDGLQRDVALRHLVAGQGVRYIATALHLPHYRVLKMLAMAHAWHRNPVQ